MNLYEVFNDKEQNLLKEAGVNVENKDYTTDECRYIVGQVMGHIMSFSKKDIRSVVDRYEGVIDRIKI